MKYIYFILAAFLLLCLAPWDYWYFMLVRFGAMIAFAFLAYRFLEQEKTGLAVGFGALALLFQPFFKIALGRTVWNIVDVAMAIALIVIWYKFERNGDEKIG